jgi:hypothetical protein
MTRSLTKRLLGTAILLIIKAKIAKKKPVPGTVCIFCMFTSYIEIVILPRKSSSRRNSSFR